MWIELRQGRGSADEWGALNGEHKRLAHAASLVEGVRFSLAILSEGDAACEAQVDTVASRVEGVRGAVGGHPQDHAPESPGPGR